MFIRVRKYIVRAVGHPVRLEERRGHSAQESFADNPKCVLDPEPNNNLPHQGELERRHDHAEFFHHLERFPQHTAGGFEPDRDERVGRRLHVLHLRVPARVRVRQLRRPETAPAQRRLPAGRESGHPETGIRWTERDCGLHELRRRNQSLYALGQQWMRDRDVLRPGAEKGTPAPDPGGQDDRRDRPDHVPVGVRRLSHILLHPLQGLLLEYDQQAPATHRLHQRQQPAAIVVVVMVVELIVVTTLIVFPSIHNSLTQTVRHDSFQFLKETVSKWSPF